MYVGIFPLYRCFDWLFREWLNLQMLDWFHGLDGFWRRWKRPWYLCFCWEDRYLNYSVNSADMPVGWAKAPKRWTVSSCWIYSHRWVYEISVISSINMCISQLLWVYRIHMRGISIIIRAITIIVVSVMNTKFVKIHLRTAKWTRSSIKIAVGPKIVKLSALPSKPGIMSDMIRKDSADSRLRTHGVDTRLRQPYCATLNTGEASQQDTVFEHHFAIPTK